MGRIRVAFTREEPVRWISHLDIQKTFQRSLRRAGIPLAYSEGFNPHPKLSFASAMAVGLVSLGEYADIEVIGDVNPQTLMEQLQKNLPLGFALLGAQRVADGSSAVMAIVDRARYRITAPLASSADEQALAKAIDLVMAAPSLPMERKGKKGLSIKDIRPGIYELAGRLNNGVLEVDATVLTGALGNVRPEEVMQSLKDTGEFPVEIDNSKIVRLGLFIEQNGILKTPLEVLEHN